jgi:O-Antigen ligase
MNQKISTYFGIILFHILIGYLVYLLPILALIYSILISVLGIIWVLKTKNKNNEVLLVCAYFVGVEVFLRMTSGIPLYEFCKYAIMFFMILGMIYKGISKNAIGFWLNLILLIPGVLIGIATLENTDRIRRDILFNISGPLCLAIAALYCLDKKITIKQINKLLLFVGLPIISCLTYLFFYTPDFKDITFGTDSNANLSGGFGANQVSTILGLGMFVFFTRLILESKNVVVFLLNLMITFYVTYRGILTFSRGGMVTGVLMILIFSGYIYIFSKSKSKFKLSFVYVFFGGLLISTFIYTSFQTNGSIDKRYANRNAAGNKKADITTGRADIFETEINIFLDNPVFGVGVGKGAEIRQENTGVAMNSHDEISRMLAEHGSLGIISLLILFLTPIFLYRNNKQHIYLFPFLTFWFLTINHAAMRTAAPCFIYALSLLTVKFDETEFET